MAVISNGDVGVGAGRPGFIAKVVEGFVPEFDAVAVIQFIDREAREVRLELRQHGAGVWMPKDRQEQIEICRL